MDLAHAAIAAYEDRGREGAEVDQLRQGLCDLAIVGSACHQNRIRYVVLLAKDFDLFSILRWVIRVFVSEAHDLQAILVVPVVQVD